MCNRLENVTITITITIMFKQTRLQLQLQLPYKINPKKTMMGFKNPD